MSYLIGAALALAVCLFALLIGFSKDGAFYPTVLIVVASYYVLFAVMGGSTHALLVEILIMCGFVSVAAMGFRTTPWLVVTALAAHGVLDLFHGHIVTNVGVPAWWPSFCSTFDVTAAFLLAWLIRRKVSPFVQAPARRAGLS